MYQSIYILLFLLFGCNTTSDGSPVSELVDDEGVSPLSVVGTQLVDEHGDLVSLRGVSFGWHNWWPRFYNANSVKWLKKDWHVNVVRAAMGVEPEDG